MSADGDAAESEGDPTLDSYVTLNLATRLDSQHLTSIDDYTSMFTALTQNTIVLTSTCLRRLKYRSSQDFVPMGL